MKKVVQLILVLFLIFIAFIFYKTYFSNKEELDVTSNENKNELSDNNELPNENKNNLIKNLKYDVRFDENKQYTISANLSEITYEDNIEIIKMQKVVAIFIDEKNIPLIITSNKAIYNNSNYNTNFSENVKIEYIDNVIISNKMDLDFKSNFISIYENVKYDGLRGVIEADNIKIDLITKKIQIYMDEKGKKVEITTKK